MFIAPGDHVADEECDVEFEPAVAKEASLAQIDAGVDALYAERFGMIEAAQEQGLLAFGNRSDQKDLAPDNVVSSVVWNLNPTAARSSRWRPSERSHSASPPVVDGS